MSEAWRLDCTVTFTIWEDWLPGLENPATMKVQEVADLIRPKRFKRRRSSFHTIVEPAQKWIWYEFDSPEEKEAYLKTIPESCRRYVMTHFTQNDLDEMTAKGGWMSE